MLCLKLFRLDFLRSEGLNFPYRRGPKKNAVTKTRDVEVSISEVVSFSNFVEIVLICSEVNIKVAIFCNLLWYRVGRQALFKRSL